MYPFHFRWPPTPGGGRGLLPTGASCCQSWISCYQPANGQFPCSSFISHQPSGLRRVDFLSINASAEWARGARCPWVDEWHRQCIRSRCRERAIAVPLLPEAVRHFFQKSKFLKIRGHTEKRPKRRLYCKTVNQNIP